MWSLYLNSVYGGINNYIHKIICDLIIFHIICVQLTDAAVPGNPGFSLWRIVVQPPFAGFQVRQADPGDAHDRFRLHRRRVPDCRRGPGPGDRRRAPDRPLRGHVAIYLDRDHRHRSGRSFDRALVGRASGRACHRPRRRRAPHGPGPGRRRRRHLGVVAAAASRLRAVAVGRAGRRHGGGGADGGSIPVAVPVRRHRLTAGHQAGHRCGTGSGRAGAGAYVRGRCRRQHLRHPGRRIPVHFLGRGDGDGDRRRRAVCRPGHRLRPVVAALGDGLGAACPAGGGAGGLG